MVDRVDEIRFRARIFRADSLMEVNGRPSATKTVRPLPPFAPQPALPCLCACALHLGPCVQVNESASCYPHGVSHTIVHRKDVQIHLLDGNIVGRRGGATRRRCGAGSHAIRRA